MPKLHAMIPAMATNVAEGYKKINEAFGPPVVREKGWEFYKPGQMATTLYVVRAGSVGINGEEPLARRGEIFGIDTAFNTVYQSGAEAMEESAVSALKRGPLHILAGSTEVGMALVGLAAGQRLDTINAQEAVTVIEPPTDIEFQILQLAARGFDRATIAERISKSLNTARAYSDILIRKLGAQSMAEAVFTGYETGLVNGEEAVEDVEFERVMELSPYDLHILDLLTENGGKNSSNVEIAQKLKRNEYTARNRVTYIIDFLKARNRIQAGMMYLVARDTGMLVDFE